MASYNLSLLYCLLISCICLFHLTEASKENGFSLNLTNRDSPLSPFYDPSETHFERLQKAFHRSSLRKTYLEAIYLRSTRTQSDAFEAPVVPVRGAYLMKIRIGTPPVDIIAVADTGSDLTWTQCKPCLGCFRQNSPLFDPAQTTSYKSVSCGTEKCDIVGQSGCEASTNNCLYLASYGDQSYTIGEVATETVTFDTDSGESISFPEVIFGCGHINNGTFYPEESGIVGLGAGASSIINQLGTSIGGRFSYCLTYPSSGVSSKINFGTNAIVTGPGLLSTPITRKSSDTFYSLTLESISVGNTRIGFKPDTDALVEEGNIVIDSGTTLTFLPNDMYKRIETELVNTIQGNRLPVDGLCYKKPSNGDFNHPPMVAHFRGADVAIPQTTSFREVSTGNFCLTFRPSDGLVIFGNMHQFNYHVGYDLQAMTVSFLPTDCSKS